MSESETPENSMHNLVEGGSERVDADIILWTSDSIPREGRGLTLSEATTLAQALLDEVAEQDKTRDRAVRARNVLGGRKP